MKATQISASNREKAGKGASRANRREGLIPAVIYGNKQAPIMISIPEKALVAEVGKSGLWTRQFEVIVDGASHRVLCQAVQKHPVSGRVLHADFLRISKDSVLTLAIPLRFENELTSPGLKLGGILNIVHRTVEVKCKADAIPEFFTIDLSTTNIGDSLTAFAIKMPDGVKLTADEDFTIATIVTASQEDEKADTPAAAAATPAAPAAEGEKKA